MADILVLGGTGKTGRRVVAKLRAAGHKARAASRSGPIRFDWTDPSTWEPAIAGADGVYLVVPETHPDLAGLMAEFLEHAAGARRIVLLSARGVDAAAGGPFLAVEHAVRTLGPQWTILRPTWFAQNFDEGTFRASIMAGTLALPAGDGREPFIDAGDIADVAVAALTQDRHAGQTYELSGPDAISFGAAVAMIAAAGRRPVVYADVTAAQFIDGATGNGMPAEFAAIMAQLLDNIRHGREAHLSDGVHRALGREPRSFADYARAAADSGAWAG